MGFKVAIPARYASTRLPGKPLRQIAGRTMLEYVHRQALASGAEEVVVATDDQRIQAAAMGFGARVVMTSPEHPSGTDRLAEVATSLGWSADQVVVNLQGDEPLMPAALIRQVAENLQHFADAGISTVATPIRDVEELNSPAAVKVVTDASGFALYFSRALIPYPRDGETRLVGSHLRHLGLYAYRVAVLQCYPQLAPSPAETVEHLEQLRALHHGIRIQVMVTPDAPPAGVDTEADLARVTALLTAGES